MKQLDGKVETHTELCEPVKMLSANVRRRGEVGLLRDNETKPLILAL